MAKAATLRTSSSGVPIVSAMPQERGGPFLGVLQDSEPAEGHATSDTEKEGVDPGAHRCISSSVGLPVICAGYGKALTPVDARPTKEPFNVDVHEAQMGAGEDSTSDEDDAVDATLVGIDGVNEKEKDIGVDSSRDGLGALGDDYKQLLSAFTKASTIISKGRTIEKLTAENQSLTTQVRALETQLRSLSDRERGAQTRVHELEERNRSLEQKAEKDEEAARAAQRRVEKLEGRVHDLEEQAARDQERERIARLRLQELEVGERAAKSYIRKLEERNDALKQNAVQAEGEIRAMELHAQRIEEGIKSFVEASARSKAMLETSIRKGSGGVPMGEQKVVQIGEDIIRLASTSQTVALPSRIQTASSTPDIRHDSRERMLEDGHLARDDVYRDSEIIQMVQSLNAEIRQCAAFTAEAVMNTDVKVLDDSRTVMKSRKRATERVGQRLVAAMRRTVETGERNRLPMQLALQHSIIVWACYIVQSFTPENRDFNAQLSGIWGKISLKEEPAVAGKWRSILAAQLKGSTSMHRLIYEECKCIMVAGGWSTKSPGSASTAVNIQSKIQAIEGSILKLKEAVVEGVTSTEIVPYTLPESHPYDPADMDSAYPGPTDPDMVKKPITCTVDMGVRRLVVNQPIASGGRTVSRSWETLLRPKVILPSVLGDEEK